MDYLKKVTIKESKFGGKIKISWISNFPQHPIPKCPIFWLSFCQLAKIEGNFHENYEND